LTSKLIYVVCLLIPLVIDYARWRLSPNDARMSSANVVPVTGSLSKPFANSEMNEVAENEQRKRQEKVCIVRI